MQNLSQPLGPPDVNPSRRRHPAAARLPAPRLPAPPSCAACGSRPGFPPVIDRPCRPSPGAPRSPEAELATPRIARPSRVTPSPKRPFSWSPARSGGMIRPTPAAGPVRVTDCGRGGAVSAAGVAEEGAAGVQKRDPHGAMAAATSPRRSPSTAGRGGDGGMMVWNPGRSPRSFAVASARDRYRCRAVSTAGGSGRRHRRVDERMGCRNPRGNGRGVLARFPPPAVPVLERLTPTSLPGNHRRAAASAVEADEKEVDLPDVDGFPAAIAVAVATTNTSRDCPRRRWRNGLPTSAVTGSTTTKSGSSTCPDRAGSFPTPWPALWK